MYRIGIDLGGTDIKAGLVDDQGNITAKERCPTGAHREYSAIIKDMAALSMAVCDKAGVKLEECASIGIGSPGTCDNKNGILLYSNNINFRNVPMRNEMQKHINKPIFIENDANCAALGEYREFSHSCDNFVMITLGTGVGGGIIANGQLITGFNGSGAELGHMSLVSGGIPCTCGRHGCWESYASVSGLIRMTEEFIAQNPNQTIVAPGGNVDGKTAFDAARRGNSAAEAIVEKWLNYVAEGIVDCINIFAPEYVIIGGAITKEGDTLLKPIEEFVQKHSYYKGENKTRVKLARLGNDAGLIGAAFLGN